MILPHYLNIRVRSSRYSFTSVSNLFLLVGVRIVINIVPRKVSSSCSVVVFLSIVTATPFVVATPLDRGRSDKKISGDDDGTVTARA